MGFFDWLSQLRITPTYSVVIAGLAAVLTPLFTLYGVRRTLRNQRALAGRDREDKRTEKLLDAIASLQSTVVPARQAVSVFSDFIWGWALGHDAIRQQAADSKPDTLKAIADIQHHLAAVYLRVDATDRELSASIESALRNCQSLYRLADQFGTDAAIGVHSAVDDSGEPHVRLKSVSEELLRDVDETIQIARSRLTAVREADRKRG
ncbi:hypothetical protein [Rhodococcus qingshengii]|uniref:hypothetical protein n=1 Tax=Rhodococcus qingshengii TaxID=334542 RepID=UPI0035DD9923